MFSCEFCEVFQNIFLTEQLRVTASENFTHIQAYEKSKA